ncbi:MAG: MarR family transcriptional regulator [Ignavibacteriaceae bacterium]|jgi:DNA-binding MarR family transcriptional regulator|nr:MarR family transcriptional regulator [Ignavibacteriaceae bacterium]
MREIQKAESLANITFNLLVRCQEKEARLAEAHKLLEAEFKCFRIMGSEENLNNNELAKRMRLSPGRITRIIDGLVEKGYMQRKIDQADRRNMILSLSKRGKNLTNKLTSAYIQIHKEILQEIDVSQHKSLLTAMEQLHSAVERWLQKPR